MSVSLSAITHFPANPVLSRIVISYTPSWLSYFLFYRSHTLHSFLILSPFILFLVLTLLNTIRAPFPKTNILRLGRSNHPNSFHVSLFSLSITTGMGYTGTSTTTVSILFQISSRRMAKSLRYLIPALVLTPSLESSM